MCEVEVPGVRSPGQVGSNAYWNSRQGTLIPVQVRIVADGLLDGLISGFDFDMSRDPIGGDLLSTNDRIRAEKNAEQFPPVGLMRRFVPAVVQMHWGS